MDVIFEKDMIAPLLLALGYLYPATVSAGWKEPTEVACNDKNNITVLHDLWEIKQIQWLRKDNSAQDCQVAFKLPPRHNFKIYLRRFNLDGNYEQG